MCQNVSGFPYRLLSFLAESGTMLISGMGGTVEWGAAPADGNNNMVRIHEGKTHPAVKAWEAPREAKIERWKVYTLYIANPLQRRGGEWSFQVILKANMHF